jgi:WD40 repeat protein
MKSRLFRFTLYSIIVHLIYTVLNPALAAPPPQDEIGAHFCGFTGLQPDSHLSDSFPNRRYSRTLANLDVGEPRTVRLIYFLPNDRPFRTSVVQRLKDDIPKIQTFYAQQMGAHGYGFRTFRIESDSKGEPMIHRVDGRHPESHYLNDATSSVVEEIGTVFNLDANIYLIIFDNSSGSIGRSAKRIGGFGARTGKDSGFALVPEPFDGPHVHVMAHELGHAFGLGHDFNNRAYLMSYGVQSQSRLSACHAEYLAVHSYFNPDSTIADAPPPTIELISPLTYPAGSESVPVHLKLTYSDGLHQVFLLRNGAEVWGCRGLAGEKHAVAEFDYDGFGGESADWNNVIGLRDSDIHHITALSVDVDGNVGSEDFTLSATESTHPRPQTLLKISEDNQQGQANTQLPYPLVVEVRDQNDNPLPNAQVTFSVIAGVGRLSGRFTLENAMTDANGRAEQPFTPGPGTNIVEATIQLQPGRIQPVAIFKVIGIGASTVPVMVGDYQRWHLPEGATRRLGKGRIGTSDRSVAFSPDGQLLAVASGIGVWLYDVAMARELALLSSASRVHSVAFSIDGKMLAAGVQGWYPDGGVVLWDVTTHKQIAALPARDYVESTSVSFSPDGGTVASGALDGSVRLWDVSTGTNTARLWGHRGYVLSVSFSPDGGIVASGALDGTVRLWDVASGTATTTLQGYSRAVLSVSFSRDGKILATGSWDGIVRLWDVTTGASTAILEGHTHEVSCVFFSPDGTTLASGSFDSTVRLWDVSTGATTAILEGHRAYIRSVSFSPTGAILASASGDRKVRLWDVSTGITAAILEGHEHDVTSVSFSPDGTTLASGSFDSTVRLWDVSTGATTAILEGHRAYIRSVSFSPTGAILASASGDRKVRLWDVSTGITAAILEGHEHDVTSVTFSPDGGTLASGSVDQTVRLWDVSTGATTAILEVPGEVVSAVSFSPDGTTIAAGSGIGTVRLWDVVTGAKIATIERRRGSVSSLAFVTDGTILAAGSGDGTVRLCDLATGAMIANLDGHASRVESVSYSPDVKILASGSVDGTILLWDISPYITPQAEGPDFDGDGAVGFADFVAFASKFGLSQRDAGYEARYDLDEDGAVGFGDFLIFASAFGKEASST